MMQDPANVLYEKRQLRKWWSLIAVFAHGITLASLFIVVSILHRNAYNSKLLFILLGQQIVAFGFSIVAYPCMTERKRDPEYHNTLKWTEYGITATLGTLAIYASSTDSFDKVWVILILSFLSTAEQLLGYDLDLAVPVNQKYSLKTWFQFGLAWVLQIIEFGFVGHFTPNLAVPLFVVYVLMWSAFGVVCGLRLYFLKSNPRHWIASRWGSELLYINLGWISKFALVATGLPYVVQPFKGVHATAWVVGTCCIFCAVFILYQTQQRASKLFTDFRITIDEDGQDVEEKFSADDFA